MNPRRRPSTAPDNSTANVCPVSGTGDHGTGIAMRAASAVTRLAATISAAFDTAPASGSTASASVSVRAADMGASGKSVRAARGRGKPGTHGTV